MQVLVKIQNLFYFQLDKLEDDDYLKFEYQSLLKTLKIGEGDIEVCIYQWNFCFHFFCLCHIYCDVFFFIVIVTDWWEGFLLFTKSTDNSSLLVPCFFCFFDKFITFFCHPVYNPDLCLSSLAYFWRFIFISA